MVHIKSSAQRTRVINVALTLFTCYLAGVGCLLTSHFVMYGDYYSDNGDGFAKYAQFVLRTNSVRPETLYSPQSVFSFLPIAQAKPGNRQA